jgi:hypothetical protein
MFHRLLVGIAGTNANLYCKGLDCLSQARLTNRSSGPVRRVALLSCFVRQRPLSSSVRVHMDRPGSVSRLALALCLSGISALGGIAEFPIGDPIAVAPEILCTDLATTGRIIVGAAGIYCVASFAAAFALWRNYTWAPVAYLGFSGSIVLYFSLFVYLIRLPTSIPLRIAFPCLLLGALYWGWRIVNRHFTRSTQSSN